MCSLSSRGTLGSLFCVGQLEGDTERSICEEGEGSSQGVLRFYMVGRTGLCPSGLEKGRGPCGGQVSKGLDSELSEWASRTLLRAACCVLQVSLQRSQHHWKRRSRRSAGVAVAKPWTPLSLSSQISSISAAKALRPSWTMK